MNEYTKTRCTHCKQFYNIAPDGIHLHNCYVTERSSMNELKTGQVVTFGGETFQIVGIVRQDSLEGKALYITACDPALADHRQKQMIKAEQTMEGAADVVKDIIDRFKNGGEGGFRIGGM